MIFLEMCAGIGDLRQQILQHPFNRELAAGVLPANKFMGYLEQDALYLADFSKALSLTSARLPQTAHTKQFLLFALAALEAEHDLHVDYLQQHRPHQPLTTTQSPACFMYTNYLLRMAALAPVEEAVASLLPCFWIYGEVGKQIAKSHQTPNPYQNWIDLYSSDEFATAIALAIDITNALGAQTTPMIQTNMIAAFKRATQLEWLFWEKAYQQETWAIRE